MQLNWDAYGERNYETGVDRGVLYLKENDQFSIAYPWNGLTSVTDKPTGGEIKPLYADDVKYVNLMAPVDFGYNIEAYTVPDAFFECDGSHEVGEGIYAHQQERRVFGFSYRTLLGDEYGISGYILHLIYNSTASVSSRNYVSIGENVEPMIMSWDVNTIPVEVPGFRPSSWVEIFSNRANPKKLAMLEEILYGTDTTDPRMPYPDEIIELFTDHAIYPSTYLYPSPTLFPSDI